MTAGPIEVVEHNDRKYIVVFRGKVQRPVEIERQRIDGTYHLVWSEDRKPGALIKNVIRKAWAQRGLLCAT